MNTVKIMRRAFHFLTQKGYAESVQKNNLEHCVSYSLLDKRIVLSYDVRTEHFSVGLQRMQGYIGFVPLLDMEIGHTVERQQLLSTITALYSEAKHDWTLSNKHFSAIVTAYAEFVEHNLAHIMEYKIQ